MIKNANIIGVMGQKRSGKDTVADYLIETENYIKYSFGDPIKRGVMAMFGFSYEQVFGDLKEVVDPRWGITPRRMLQIIGTELFQYDIYKHTEPHEMVDANGEEIRRNIWVNRFKIWYGELNEEDMFGPHQVVVADVRFPHEVKGIRELGGVIWKVVRPSIERKDRHKSETELDQIVPDETIINDGSMEDLYKKIEIIFKKSFVN